MERTRREFLRDAAALGVGAWAIAACGKTAGAAGGAASAAGASVGSVRPSLDNAGIQLFTVRDRLGPRFEETLAALAAIGYREVEPFTYNDWTPEQIKGMLDRTGIRAPSTHVTARPGPDLEKTLAGFQLMGHKYARAAPATRPRPTPLGGPGTIPGAAPNGAPPNGVPPNGAPPAPPPGGFTMPMPTLESVQREIDAYNEVGRAAKPYGITVIVHNHTMEFAKLPDGRTPFDLMLAELDPSVAVLELDIGWATVAGQNALSLFAAHPGRFPLWHVKDMANLDAVNSNGNDEAARMRAAKIVPLGQGEIDYGPIFARAGTAGLRHYFVEQDTAPDSGDSLAAARTSFEALRRILLGMTSP